MMKAARTSETMVNFCQTTRRYNPEDSHLRTHRRENLKSYIISHLNAFVLLHIINIFVSSVLLHNLAFILKRKNRLGDAPLEREGAQQLPPHLIHRNQYSFPINLRCTKKKPVCQITLVDSQLSFLPRFLNA
jgi:hypothetical protein